MCLSITVTITVTGVNGLEFSVKTGDYKDLMRSSSVDLIDSLDEECESCHSRMRFSFSL